MTKFDSVWNHLYKDVESTASQTVGKDCDEPQTGKCDHPIAQVVAPQ